MFNTLIILTVVLIGAILFTLFRVGTLLSVAKKESKQKTPSGNNLNAFLMAALIFAGIVAFFGYSSSNFSRYTLPLASEHGAEIDFLFWTTMAVTVTVFILTHVVLMFFTFRYKHSEERKAYFYPENNKLEMLWTAVPAVVMAGLVLMGLKSWNGITGPSPDDAELLEVYGYQFGWKARYPGNDKKLGAFDFRVIDAINDMGIDFTDKNALDDFTPLEITLPKGKPVEMKIRAKDVIHSVFIPHFRVQMNAVPGMPTRFWFTPTKTTDEMRLETGNEEFNYELVCNKICGKAHFAMRAIVKVVEPEEYEEWKAKQKPWLQNNPDYLSKVPEDLKELALLKSGLEKTK
jgi:cytochrome c oxidase subunit 2